MEAENNCTRKKAFESKEEALSRVLEIQEEENLKEKKDRGKVPLRAYKCSDCQRWHLTSMPRKKFNKVQEGKKRWNPDRQRFYREVQYWMEKLGVKRED